MGDGGQAIPFIALNAATGKFDVTPEAAVFLNSVTRPTPFAGSARCLQCCAQLRVQAAARSQHLKHALPLPPDLLPSTVSLWPVLHPEGDGDFLTRPNAFHVPLVCTSTDFEGTACGSGFGALTGRLSVQIDEPVAVIAVVGLYRTGKSFLMNRILLNQSGGFQVGGFHNLFPTLLCAGGYSDATGGASSIAPCRCENLSPIQKLAGFHEGRIRVHAQDFVRRPGPPPRTPSHEGFGETTRAIGYVPFHTATWEGGSPRHQRAARSANCPTPHARRSPSVTLQDRCTGGTLLKFGGRGRWGPR